MLALGASALAYLVTAGAESLWQVYLGRALSGLAAGSLPVASALMADLSSPERRAKAMGLVGTAFGLGLIVGLFWVEGSPGERAPLHCRFIRRRCYHCWPRP